MKVEVPICTKHSDCSDDEICKQGRCVDKPKGTDPTEPPVIPPSLKQEELSEE